MIQPNKCDVRRILRTGLTLAFVMGTCDAYAEPTRREQAETLFNEALSLVEAGHDAEGCPKFEKSFALYRSASTMINIARCHERQGKVATASQDYQQAIDSSKETPDAQRRQALLDIAQQGMQALAPRLPKLRIVIPNAPVNTEVLRGETKVPSAALFQDLPVDPGQHTIRVRAPGHRPETRFVTVEEGKVVTLEFKLQPVDTWKDDPMARPRNYWRTVGITLIAGGATGFGVGAVAGALSLEKVNEIKDICGGVHCSTTDTVAREELNSALALGTLSTGSFIAGGVLATTGTVFLLVDRMDARKSPVTPSFGFSFGTRQVLLKGDF